MEKFGSIEQFKNVIKHVRDNSKYHGTPLPTLEFIGTVKLHGTSAGFNVAPDDPNFCMVDRFLTVRDYHYSSIIDPGLVLIEMIKDNQIESSREFLIDWLKGCYLDQFMDKTRKCWMPGGHEGSQSDIGPEYTTLIGAIQMGIDKRKEEYGEDE